MRSEAQKYYIQHNLCGALDYDAILNRNELRGKADGAGLPTYTVADAGRTQVLSYFLKMLHFLTLEFSSL